VLPTQDLFSAVGRKSQEIGDSRPCGVSSCVRLAKGSLCVAHILEWLDWRAVPKHRGLPLRYWLLEKVDEARAGLLVCLPGGKR